MNKNIDIQKQNKRKEKTRQSVMKTIWSAIMTVAVIFTLILAILLVGVRVVGYTPYAILSGSMTPAYNVGDLVYVKSTDPENINVKDTITFVYDESLTVVTHRVIKVDRENRCFVTQGDANDIADGSPVLYENVLGVVKFSLPVLGYVSSYITGPTGRYIGIAIIFLLLLLMILPGLFKKRDNKNTAEHGQPL